MDEGVRIESQKYGKEDFNIFIRLSTTKQKLLLVLYWKTLINGEKGWSINQRSVAKKLHVHYNSLYEALQELLAEEKIISKKKGGQKNLTINLSSHSNIRLLLMLSKNFYKHQSKQLESIPLPFDEEVEEKAQESFFNDKTFRQELDYVLSHKEEFAELLATALYNELEEKERKKITTLDTRDYKTIIHQQLLKCTDLLDEPVETFLPRPEKKHTDVLDNKIAN